MKRSTIILMVISLVLVSGMFIAGCVSDSGSTEAQPSATMESAGAAAGANDNYLDSGRTGQAAGTPPEGMQLGNTTGQPPTGNPSGGTLSGNMTRDRPSGTPPSGTPPSGTPPSKT